MTKVPRPCSRRTSPAWTSDWTASRTVFRPAPTQAMSSASTGMRSPTGHAPDAIASWKRAVTASVRLGGLRTAVTDGLASGGFIPSSDLWRRAVNDDCPRGVLPLVAVVLTALNLRTAVTGFTPLLDVIGDDLGFGPSLYGVLGTVVTASFAVFGLLAAPVARRLGLERTVAVAVALTTTGIVLRALAPSTPALVAATVVAFTGVGASNVLVVPWSRSTSRPA